MSTRRIRFVLAAAMLATLGLAAAPGALAQGNCVIELERSGGDYVVVGSGFGDPVVVTVFRDGTQVDRAQLTITGFTGSFRYEVDATTTGPYRVLAVTPESECGDELTFTVLPDSATDGMTEPRSSGSNAALAVLALAATLGLLFPVLRSRGVSRKR